MQNILHRLSLMALLLTSLGCPAQRVVAPEAPKAELETFQETATEVESDMGVSLHALRAPTPLPPELNTAGGYAADLDAPSVRGRKWPGGKVPYEIGPGFSASSVQSIQAAISHIESLTPIRFPVRTSELHYVVFIPTSGATGSAIGMQMGRQELWLYSGAGQGTVVHELGHALGLLHTRSRPDVRSAYEYDAAAAGANYAYCEDRFLNHTNSRPANTYGSFDYISIMEYHDGCILAMRPAIKRILGTTPVTVYNSFYHWGTVLPDGRDFKMARDLSPGDVATLKTLYAADPCGAKTQPPFNHSCGDNVSLLADTVSASNPGMTRDEALDWASKYCPGIAAQGWCTDYARSDWVHETCAGTCGTCK